MAEDANPVPLGQDDPIILNGRDSDAGVHALRDFLQRSGINYECNETEQLIAADLPGGQRLAASSTADLAHVLGLVAETSRGEYDLSIYDTGPAGLSAAVYAASEGLSTVLNERNTVGGQVDTTSLIENYLGFPKGRAGVELAARVREQALKFGGEIMIMREGVKAVFKDGKILARLANVKTMVTRANICATGVDWRRLGLERETDFLGAGVYYGAGISEAPLCKGKHVIVVGSENSAGQAVMYLAEHAKTVTMVVRGSALAASMSSYLSERIEKAKDVDLLFDAEMVELAGDDRLQKIRIETSEGDVDWYDRQHRLVAIGGKPHTEWARDTDIVRHDSGFLITGPDLLNTGKPPECRPLVRAPHLLETRVPGSFAAGDVRRRSIKRVATAVGEGAMAVSFVHRYLEESQR